MRAEEGGSQLDTFIYFKFHSHFLLMCHVPVVAVRAKDTKSESLLSETKWILIDKYLERTHFSGPSLSSFTLDE
jgi:hypothetical protein